jgi:hypothetical protein
MRGHVGPCGHAKTPWWRESNFRGPDRFAFAIKGEVEAPEMDHRFGGLIGVVASHLELEELRWETRKPPTWHAKYQCFKPCSDK